MNVKTISILILTVSIPCFVYSVNSASWEVDEVTRISEIIDGDTFDTTSGDRIRLADIDAPENDESGYLQAKYFLYGLLHGREIFLDIDDLYTYDTSGTRLVCLVFVECNSTHFMNVNEALLVEGFAEVWDHENEFDPETWILYCPEEMIPEFPSFLILPLFMIATLLTVIVHRRKCTM
jgi:endonuclease YncB( thermonuclease family)